MSSPESPTDLETLGLPPIDQVGFVVRSIEETKARYSALFGPWREMDGSVRDADYRGRKEDEFIEWKDGHSPHREFIEAGREGMHHLRYRVEDTDAWVEKVAPLGYVPIWYKRFTEDTIFAYLEREGDPLLIEFLQMPEAGPGTS